MLYALFSFAYLSTLIITCAMAYIFLLIAADRAMEEIFGTGLFEILAEIFDRAKKFIMLLFEPLSRH